MLIQIIHVFRNMMDKPVVHVTKKHFQTTADGGGNYTLDYSFADSKGNKINGSNRVTKQQWDSLKDGDTWK